MYCAMGVLVHRAAMEMTFGHMQLGQPQETVACIYLSHVDERV